MTDLNVHLSCVNNYDIPELSLVVVADMTKRSIVEATAKAVANAWNGCAVEVAEKHFTVHTGKLCGDVKYKLDGYSKRTGGTYVKM